MTKTALPEPMKAKGTLAGLKKRLEKGGYSVTGEGFFATVWTKDDVAIKVAIGDIGYDTWLEECLKNQGNPYFPKIFDVKRFTDVKRERTSVTKLDVTVVSMERLEKKEDKYQAEQLGTKYGRARSRKIKTNDKHERELFKALNRVESSRGWLDIHSENILFRGDQPVITDPVA